MTTVTLKLSQDLKHNLWLWNTITINPFLRKVSLSSDIVLPDLQFIDYKDLSESQKLMYDNSKKIKKEDLVNL